MDFVLSKVGELQEKMRNRAINTSGRRCDDTFDENLIGRHEMVMIILQ